jgi:hypothetical protein
MPARAALFAHFQRTSFSIETLRRFRSQSLIRGDLLKRPALFYRAPV